MKAIMKIPDKVSALNGRLEISISRKHTGGADLYYADGDFSFTDPPFEPQLRLDPKEGFTFEIEPAAPERILAIYQHKSWWVRPCFPAGFSYLFRLLLQQRPYTGRVFLPRLPPHGFRASPFSFCGAE